MAGVDAEAMTLRVLFVDDEEHILLGLTRLLRAEHDLSLLTARSAAQALEILQLQPHDPPVHVVVSDQRMPSCTGLELLAQVKERYPQVRRIILSGSLLRENAGPAHVVLSKPCRREELLQAIRASEPPPPVA